MAVGDKDKKSPPLALVLGGCVGLVGIALLGTRLLRTEVPPPEPLPPAPNIAPATGDFRFTPAHFNSIVEEDAKRLGLKFEETELKQVLPYAEEVTATKWLKVNKDHLETPHLRLETTTAKQWANTSSNEGFRYEHIFLRITNLTDKHLAYRVRTDIVDSEKCASKGAVPHNALALRPHETITRSECLFREKGKLIVDRVEVMELTPLGYHYISRLVPTQVFANERTAAGHTLPTGDKACRFIPAREILDGQTGPDPIHWADVIDFYARHNCDEYSFSRSYRRWTVPGTLPYHPI